MKKIWVNLSATFLMTALALPALAQTGSDDQVSSAPTEEIMAPSPKLQDPNRTGFFQAGVGPAVGMGMDSDNLMYNVFASYNRVFTPQWSGKILGDAYLSGGGDNSRFLNLAVGGDYLLTNINFGQALPYIGANIGFGGARNDAVSEDDETGVAVGAEAGFKFLAADLAWDVNLAYSLLTSEVGDTIPSVLALRAGVNF